MKKLLLIAIIAMLGTGAMAQCSNVMYYFGTTNGNQVGGPFHMINPSNTIALNQGTVKALATNATDLVNKTYADTLIGSSGGTNYAGDNISISHTGTVSYISALKDHNDFTNGTTGWYDGWYLSISNGVYLTDPTGLTNGWLTW